jgi:hypothetical protein
MGVQRGGPFGARGRRKTEASKPTRSKSGCAQRASSTSFGGRGTKRSDLAPARVGAASRERGLTINPRSPAKDLAQQARVLGKLSDEGIALTNLIYFSSF